LYQISSEFSLAYWFLDPVVYLVLDLLACGDLQ